MEKEAKLPMFSPAGDKNFHIVKINDTVIFCSNFFKIDDLICMKDAKIADSVYPDVYSLLDVSDVDVKVNRTMDDNYIYINKSTNTKELNTSNFFTSYADNFDINETYAKPVGFLTYPFGRFKGANSYNTGSEITVPWAYTTKDQAIKRVNERRVIRNEKIIKRVLGEVSNVSMIERIHNAIIERVNNIQNETETIKEKAASVSIEELAHIPIYRWKKRMELWKNYLENKANYVEQEQDKIAKQVVKKCVIKIDVLKEKVEAFLRDENSDNQIGIKFKDFIDNLDYAG